MRCAQVSARGGVTEHVGAVVAHAAQCGSGSGVFLRVRDCELLLLAAAAPSRGAMLPAPYLDTYGETDQVTSTLISPLKGTIGESDGVWTS